MMKMTKSTNDKMSERTQAGSISLAVSSRRWEKRGEKIHNFLGAVPLRSLARPTPQPLRGNGRS